MQFRIGLSVGMQLGKVMADYLEKLIEAYNLLDKRTVEKISRIEKAEEKLVSVVDQLAK